MSNGASDAVMHQENQQVASLNRNKADLSHMKVAIVCDWLTGIGGAERVVLELHRMFPDAPIYTSQYDPTKLDWFKDAEVHTTWLQKLPKNLKKFLPLFRALSFRRLDLSAYDLVISSSGAEAKAVKTGPQTIHVCYCHAPTHYYWSRYEDYLRNPGFGVFDWLARIGLKTLVGPLRRLDYQAAQRPNYIIANSNFTQNQIKKYYGRDSVVIHPPVDVERFTSLSKEKQNRQGFVVAGRQTPYKKIDLAVAACTKLNLPLTVIGNGPDHDKLVKMAGPTINFVTDADDKQIGQYFQDAEAFIFPGIDDFGIVAVEAMAAGTPVVAYKDGGALDYVILGKTGMFFDEQSADALAKVLQQFKQTKFDSEILTEQSQLFSTTQFKRRILAYIDEIMV